MSLNPDLIRARCEEIEASVSRLEKFRSMPRETFLSQQDALDIASYRLLVAIEAALALCFHVSAKRLHRAPGEYAECFAALHEGGLVPADLAQRLQQMARFRNMLVHVYWKIDYGRLYDLIHQSLGDLKSFSALMAGLL